MLIARPPKVIKEGEELIVELNTKGIKDPLMLNFNLDLKKKVLTFLDDVRKAIDWVQGQIIDFVGKASGNTKERIKGLRIQETNLVSVQGRLLQLVRERR